MSLNAGDYCLWEDAKTGCHIRVLIVSICRGIARVIWNKSMNPTIRMKGPPLGAARTCRSRTCRRTNRE